MTNAVKTSWTLKGQVIIACNCDYGCPCNFNALPPIESVKAAGPGTWSAEQSMASRSTV